MSVAPPGSSKGSAQPKWTEENCPPPPPASSVSLYELGFGTVAGICAGVFVKKGAKMVAWFLGGIFVFLQVCVSLDGSRALRFSNIPCGPVVPEFCLFCPR